ncbi:hypothetical protein ACFL0H_06785 [Thermodesulfobacteriota bacterium]
MITDASSGQPVPCDLIEMIRTDAGTSGACVSGGYYIIFHPQGTFTLTVEAQGYAPLSQGITVVAGSNQLNFVLSGDSIKKADINNDLTIDLTDAILVLQVLDRIEPSSTVYKQADVNGKNKIGMEEIIYILQEVSELR